MDTASPSALTVAEVARALRCCRATARRLCRSIGVRVGRDLRVEREALNEWVRSRAGLPPRTAEQR